MRLAETDLVGVRSILHVRIAVLVVTRTRAHRIVRGAASEIEPFGPFRSLESIEECRDGMIVLVLVLVLVLALAPSVVESRWRVLNRQCNNG